MSALLADVMLESLGITLSIAECAAQEPWTARTLHEWHGTDGEPWALIGRTPRGYVVRFLDEADFEIRERTSEVVAVPTTGADPALVEHLFLNQVVPLVQSRRGYLVLHASAVEVDGQALAFVAESGAGKSTLAGCFTRAGHRFLTDDGLAISFRGSSPIATPGHASLRLWPDSAAAVLDPRKQAVKDLANSNKARFLFRDPLDHCPSPLPLSRIYLLGKDRPGFTVHRLAEGDAFRDLMRHSFILDPEARAGLVGHFEQLAQLATGGRCYRIDFPRRYQCLDAVREALLEHRSR